MADERELIRAAQSGDGAAFDRLVDLHGARVLAVARRLCGSVADAQDVAQDTFLRLYRHIGRVDASRPLEPWVVRIAVNVARDFVRKRGRHEHGHDDVEGETLQAAEAHPGARLEAQQIRAAIESAVATLPERERLVFQLKELERLDVQVVAEVLEVKAVTVRRQAMEARKKIESWIREYRPELLPRGRPEKERKKTRSE